MSASKVFVLLVVLVLIVPTVVYVRFRIEAWRLFRDIRQRTAARKNTSH